MMAFRVRYYDKKNFEVRGSTNVYQNYENESKAIGEAKEKLKSMYGNIESFELIYEGRVYHQSEMR